MVCSDPVMSRSYSLTAEIRGELSKGFGGTWRLRALAGAALSREGLPVSEEHV